LTAPSVAIAVVLSWFIAGGLSRVSLRYQRIKNISALLRDAS
jgi:hypothetical protein